MNINILDTTEQEQHEHITTLMSGVILHEDETMGDDAMSLNSDEDNGSATAMPQSGEDGESNGELSVESTLKDISIFEGGEQDNELNAEDWYDGPVEDDIPWFQGEEDEMETLDQLSDLSESGSDDGDDNQPSKDNYLPFDHERTPTNNTSNFHIAPIAKMKATPQPEIPEEMARIMMGHNSFVSKAFISHKYESPGRDNNEIVNAGSTMINTSQNIDRDKIKDASTIGAKTVDDSESVCKGMRGSCKFND